MRAHYWITELVRIIKSSLFSLVICELNVFFRCDNIAHNGPNIHSANDA